MKKLVLLGLAILLIAGVSFAEPIKLGEVIEKLPALKQGVAFNLEENKLEYLSTIEVASYKGFSLEAGYSSENALVGVISYPVLNLKDLGVTLPVLDLVECNVGVFFGVKRLEGIESFKSAPDTTYGISATLISLKF